MSTFLQGGEGELHVLPVLILEFALGVTLCPPGAASYSTHLRNRGFDNWPEITVWPKNQHMRLTTGAEYKRLGAPEEVSLTSQEKQMCAILGLNELELHVFLREWKSPVTYARLEIGGRMVKIGDKPENLEQLKRALKAFEVKKVR